MHLRDSSEERVRASLVLGAESVVDRARGIVDGPVADFGQHEVAFPWMVLPRCSQNLVFSRSGLCLLKQKK